MTSSNVSNNLPIPRNVTVSSSNVGSFTTPPLPKRARIGCSNVSPPAAVGRFLVPSPLLSQTSNSVVPRPTNTTLLSRSRAAPTDEDANLQKFLAARREATISIYGSDVQCLPCLCLVPEEIKITTEIPDSCQARDSVNNTIVACCDPLMTDAPILVRSHIRDKLKAVCDNHLLRLRFHQCCPGCGVFCLKGKFNKCRETYPPHYFHLLCSNELGQCPHCLSNNYGPAEIDLTNIDLCNGKARISMTLPKIVIDYVKKPEDVFRRRHTHRLLGSDKEICTADFSDMADRELIRQAIGAIDPNITASLELLEKAMNQNDLRILLSLFVKKMNVNTRLSNGSTLLQHASVNGHFHICYVLILLGADVETIEEVTGRTALIMAAAAGNYSICKLLICYGKANALHKDKSNDTGLHLAAKIGAAEIVELLIYGTNIRDIDGQDLGGWTPLMWAAENGQLDTVELLLSAGGNRCVLDNEGNLALHWAAMSGMPCVGRALLAHRCEDQINKQNALGYTPLMIACRENHLAFIEMLLCNGADPRIKDHEQKTAETYLRANSNRCDGDGTLTALQIAEKLRTMPSPIRKKSKLIMADFSKGKENVWISVYNDVDNATVDDIIYVTKYVETTQASKVDWHISPSILSCACSTDCGTDATGKKCLCAASNRKIWYNEAGRLVSNFPYGGPNCPPYIFECNMVCRCPLSCRNRVNLKLVRTADKGWGVFAAQDVLKGTFVCEYAGELVTDRDAEAREEDTYLFELSDANVQYQGMDMDRLCVDASRYGNISRFINHGCDGNLWPMKVFYDHYDVRAPHLAFFALKNIRKDEELTFDYGPKFWDVKSQQFSCKCRSKNCKYSGEKK